MSDIVLSASVRQNLLSLQSTADLLATTQNRLSTGKKVNTALDNPTNFFTAASLDNRANDISNLLDGIGNGVQVLQAANTGITSLEKLVDSAKSVANQVLQSTVGYSPKSSITTAPIVGASAQNLLGTAGAPANNLNVGSVENNNHIGAYLSSTSVGAAVSNDRTPASALITGATQLVGTAGSTSNDLSTAISNGSTLVVNGISITFSTAQTSVTGSAGAGFTIGIGAGSTQSVQSVLTAIDAITTAGGGASTVDSSGKLNLATGTASDLTITGTGNALAALGLGTGVTQARGNAATTATPVTGATLLSGGASPSSNSLSSGFTTSDTVVINGTTINFTAAGSGLQDATHVRIDDNISTLLGKIDAITGGSPASTVDSSGHITLSTGTAADLVTSGSGLAKLGLTAGTTLRTAAGSLINQTLTIPKVGDGTAATITFGTGIGQVSSLNDLNNALQGDNLQATIDSSGVITITTANEAASFAIGAVGGSAAATGNAFAGLVGSTPVLDPTSQSARAGLVSQYNNILAQITTTAQDSSFNGVNLLNGDTLKLIFNETGKSILNISGFSSDASGLGLSSLTAGTDFLDSGSANSVLSSLDNAASTLRTQASSLGSNLSIVQIRQDFSKNLIDVLQTGSSNLTLADTNEEAANSQALSTRQSIAVSALALANQSQQSVLQLLR